MKDIKNRAGRRRKKKEERKEVVSRAEQKRIETT